MAVVVAPAGITTSSAPPMPPSLSPAFLIYATGSLLAATPHLILLSHLAQAPWSAQHHPPALIHRPAQAVLSHQAQPTTVCLAQTSAPHHHHHPAQTHPHFLRRSSLSSDCPFGTCCPQGGLGRRMMLFHCVPHCLHSNIVMKGNNDNASFLLLSFVNCVVLFETGGGQCTTDVKLCGCTSANPQGIACRDGDQCCPNSSNTGTNDTCAANGACNCAANDDCPMFTCCPKGMLDRIQCMHVIQHHSCVHTSNAEACVHQAAMLRLKRDAFKNHTDNANQH